MNVDRWLLGVPSTYHCMWRKSYYFDSIIAEDKSRNVFQLKLIICIVNASNALPITIYFYCLLCIIPLVRQKSKSTIVRTIKECVIVVTTSNIMINEINLVSFQDGTQYHSLALISNSSLLQPSTTTDRRRNERLRTLKWKWKAQIIKVSWNEITLKVVVPCVLLFSKNKEKIEISITRY